MRLERIVALHHRLQENGHITQEEYDLLNVFEEINPRLAERAALRVARHALVTLNGLFAADGAAPELRWHIDETKTLAIIDAALGEGK